MQRLADNVVMSLSGPVKLSSEEEHKLLQKWQNELSVCSEVIVSNSFMLHFLIRRIFVTEYDLKEIKIMLFSFLLCLFNEPFIVNNVVLYTQFNL